MRITNEDLRRITRCRYSNHKPMPLVYGNYLPCKSPRLYRRCVHYLFHAFEFRVLIEQFNHPFQGGRLPISFWRRNRNHLLDLFKPQRFGIHSIQCRSHFQFLSFAHLVARRELGESCRGHSYSSTTYSTAEGKSDKISSTNCAATRQSDAREVKSLSLHLARGCRNGRDRNTKRGTLCVCTLPSTVCRETSYIPSDDRFAVLQIEFYPQG